MNDLTPAERDAVQLPPEDAILHPDCPTELWWGLAKDYPLDAMVSVLYPLLTLESPERWTQLEEDNVEKWIELSCKKLAPFQAHLFAADCAERVLAIFEAEYPDDKRPREAIRVRRLFARGEVTAENWHAAWDAALYALEKAQEDGEERGDPSFSGGIADAAWAIVSGAADEDHPFRVNDTSVNANPTIASSLAADARFFAAQHDTCETEKSAEFRWQWGRLRQYLRGEVP